MESVSELVKKIARPFNVDDPISKTISSPITVGRPPKESFFRIKKGLVIQLYVYEDQMANEKKTWAVMTEVLPYIGSDAKAKEFHLAVTTDGSLYLWGSRLLISEDEKLDTWTKSIRMAKEYAENLWIRCIPKINGGGYEIKQAVDQPPEPNWPDYSEDKILELTMGDSIISSSDHFIIKKLRGEMC